jgi:hypothetical protein
MNTHLAIDFSGQHVHFSLLRNGNVYNTFQTSLNSVKEHENKEQLNLFIKENNSLGADFDEITLSYATSRSTIVPNNIFDESGPKDLFKICFGKETDDSEIDYNRISEHSVINLYHIPTWIKSFFVIKYPRIVIQHEGTHLIRQALQKGFKLKVYAILHAEHFQLSIIKHNEIQYYSAFDYQTYEDLLYHLLFVLQQKELVQENGELMLIQGSGATQDILNQFMSNVSKVGDLNKYDVNQSNSFIAQSQLLCV